MNLQSSSPKPMALLRRFGSIMAGALVSSKAAAAETISWYDPHGHDAGDLTHWQEAGGLMVRLRVGAVSSAGMTLFRAELFNPGAEIWRGGVCVSDRQPETHDAVLTVPAGQMASWWTHLSPRACLVSVRVDPAARGALVRPPSDVR